MISTTSIFGTLAQVKLEDVFKSTQQSMDGGVSGKKLFALFLGALALIMVLAFLQYRKRHAATIRTMHSPPKLLKEALKEFSLKSSEVRQLRQLAEEQECESPLTLVLCPSVLEKALAKRSSEERAELQSVVSKLR